MKITKQCAGIVLALGVIPWLSTCSLVLKDQGDAGTFTITIGGSNARTAAPEWLGLPELDALTHTIHILDENGVEHHRAEDIRYGGRSSFSVSPGRYTFYVEAFYDGELKAAGREERTISSGQNPAITIQMTDAFTGITATYAQGGTTVYVFTPLDSLKTGLTVTANYRNNTSLHVTDYELSGTLAAGTSTITVTYKGGQTATFTVNVSAIGMVRIPGGTFVFGQNLGTGGGSDTAPTSSITLTDFYIGTHEVTQEQWQAVMGTNPSYFTANADAGETQKRRPVEMVSWHDALVFCNKLSMLEGFSPAYSIVINGNPETDPARWGTVPTDYSKTWDAVTIDPNSTGYRLPTEAQWEYAAKGGDPSAAGWTGYTYSGSDDPDKAAWYGGNNNNKTHEVGKKAPNILGLFDMSGNVSEWCWDWYDGYSEGTIDRAYRGGGYDSSAGIVRSVNRNIRGPYYRYRNIGLRLVRPN